MHSGKASGTVPSSFRIMRMLLDRYDSLKFVRTIFDRFSLEDPITGRVKVPELYAVVPEQRVEQINKCAEELKDEAFTEFPFVQGASALSYIGFSLILMGIRARGFGSVPAPFEPLVDAHCELHRR